VLACRTQVDTNSLYQTKQSQNLLVLGFCFGVVYVLVSIRVRQAGTLRLLVKA
jgi:hypothetical protein